MKTSRKISALFLAALLVLTSACSQDDGDGKDEKGNLQRSAANILSEGNASAIRCASHDELRNQCYREILKNAPELISELNGANPFLLKSWDQIDFSSSTFLKEITNCRVSFPSKCN